MKAINQTAKAILDKLTEGMNEGEENHRRIDNAPGVFMAAVVECIGRCSLGLLFSVCHYGEQNGDLMRDPEMCFIKAHLDGNFYPYYFRNDYAGVEQESIFFDGNGTVEKFAPRLQKDHAFVAGAWMKNIQQQQSL